MERVCPRGLGAHPCPVMVAAQTRQLSGNGNETLVAMEIPNTSDSDVALLWQLHPKPSGGSAGAIYFSLVAEKGSESPIALPHRCSAVTKAVSLFSH